MGVRDLEIARSVTLKPIQAIGEALGLAADDLEPYGRLKAKVFNGVIIRSYGKMRSVLLRCAQR